MEIIQIQSILDKALIGKIISPNQPRIPENCWGAKIQGISPCDLNYGCDSGFHIYTDAIGGCSSFTVDAYDSIVFDN